MAESAKFATVDDAEPDTEESNSRDRSTIAFPYGDLEEAERVPRALLDRGGGSGDYSQLAAWLNHNTVNSGGFRQKVATARHFNLVKVESGTIRLTDSGRAILDPSTVDSARVSAFLSVPLYKAIFEVYEGGLLPADVGLEAQMGTFGVAAKQTAKARQAMVRSAKTAGFFDGGVGRLVRPAVSEIATAGAPDSRGGGAKPSGEDGGRPPTQPPSGDSKKVITLCSGGEISVTVSVDLFAMSREDREFVNKLIDELADYEAGGDRKLLSSPDAEAPNSAVQAAV